MRRRDFLLAGGASALCASGSEDHEPHFPDRLHQFVFRNWELANIESMARVAGCGPAKLLAAGRAMGLPSKPRLTGDQLRRIYITTIRQNWRLLPDEQIVELLGWTPDKFAFTLREDDFLDVKLGPKPPVERLVYRAPSAESRRRAAEIARTLRAELGREPRGEPPFAFVERLSRATGREPAAGGQAADPTIIYSYFALYGDPLLEPEIDPFPDGYLERLADLGINGVWMQAVLRTLAGSRAFPEFGSGSEKRLATLNRLVDRARRFGIKLYLYLNEPRSMPAEFYRAHPEIRGARSRAVYAMCTAVPQVRQWISESVAHVFHETPGLGGVFSITMSENLTNCFSHGGQRTCPRCAGRKPWEGVGEVLDAIYRGVRAYSRDAVVTAWDWAWPEEVAEHVIPNLPRDSRFQSVSEWSIPIERGGVKTTVGEYSISVVGPGPRATRHWGMARAAGVAPMAKVQLNNTWEISAVPYIPVPQLVARHCANLRRAGVRGMQASWTLGGFPSPNLAIARDVQRTPSSEPDAVVRKVAADRYGDAAPQVVEAWQAFSDAFQEFPYGLGLYIAPTQHGPANLLRPRPTGIRGSMILFPQDDYRGWSGAYPPQVARDQFVKVADGWERGLAILRKALAGRAEACRRPRHRRDLRHPFPQHREPIRVLHRTRCRPHRPCHCGERIGTGAPPVCARAPLLGAGVRSQQSLLLPAARPGREDPQLPMDPGIEEVVA